MSDKDRINLGAKAVSLAIQHGDLPSQRSQMCAGGCGRRAEQYHHYNGYEDWQLVDVIPVCRYCHSLADRLRNQEEVDLDRPNVRNLMAVIERERHICYQRRLYLLKEFQSTEYRCRYLVLRPGKNPVAIFTNLGMPAFSEYMYCQQAEGVTLDIECVLCGCSLSWAVGECACPCHNHCIQP